MMTATAQEKDRTPQPYNFVTLQGGGQVTFTNNAFDKLATSIAHTEIMNQAIVVPGHRLCDAALLEQILLSVVVPGIRETHTAEEVDVDGMHLAGREDVREVEHHVEVAGHIFEVKRVVGPADFISGLVVVALNAESRTDSRRPKASHREGADRRVWHSFP